MSTSEWITQYNEDALMADGFEEAIIGVAERCSQPTLVVYDAERCIEILQRDSEMTEEEAHEFFEFNTLGAWVGENTPLFLWRKPRDTGETQTLCPRVELPNHN
jgi:hypothetical protein